MRFPPSLRVVIGALLLVFCGGAAPAWAETKKEANPRLAAPTATFVSEEEWIVDSVARDILSYAAYIARGKDAKPWSEPELLTKTEGPAFQVTWKFKPDAAEETGRIEISTCVWLPETYGAWTASLVPKSAPAKPAASGLLEALLTPTAENQQKENKRVSEWLTREPANPAAHEEAALVLSSLGLRECAGAWTDRRSTISRVTAHLALATALRGEGARTEAGQVANIWLHVTLQRALEADGMIAALRSNPSRPVQAWLNALGMVNTADWRQSKDPVHASLLEQEKILEALLLHTPVVTGLTFLASQKKMTEVPDGIRACLDRDFRVTAGHILTEHAFEQELAEIRTLSGGSRTPAEFVAWLNTTPGLPVAANAAGKPAVRVIDPGMWARYSQRHLLYTISCVGKFYRMLGAPEARRELALATEPLVGGLVLGASLARAQATEQSSYDAAMKQLGNLSREHPEWIGPGLWSALSTSPAKPLTLTSTLPKSTEWFKPAVPRGCAQASGARARLAVGKNAAYLEGIRALNPYDPGIAINLVNLRKENAETARKTFGPLNDYSVHVMESLAGLLRAEPTAYRLQMERLCTIDPAAYMKLGRYLADHLYTEEAAVIFEKGVAAAPDEVDMSNQCHWLVNYYFQKGRLKDAMALAQRATATGSARGMSTVGLLYEQMGDLANAVKSLQEIEERYGNNGALISFYGRHRHDPAHPEYQGLFVMGALRRFPKGLEPVTLASFSGAPQGSCHFGEILPPHLIEAGLHVNASIVAVNGQRVINSQTYDFLRDSSPAPTFEVIVWQDGKYDTKTVRTKPPLVADYEL